MASRSSSSSDNSQYVYYFRGLPHPANLTANLSSNLGSQVQNLLPLLPPHLRPLTGTGLSNGELSTNDLLANIHRAASLSSSNGHPVSQFNPHHQSMVINMESINTPEPQLPTPSSGSLFSGTNLLEIDPGLHQTQQQQQTPSQQAQQTNQHSHSQAQDLITRRTLMQGQHTHTHHEHNRSGHSDWRIIFQWLQKSGIFAVILFIKVMYDHRLGLLVFLNLFGTFCYANRALDRQTHQLVTRQGGVQRKSLMTKLWLMAFLFLNILCIYIVFADQKLYKILYFQLPSMEKMDIWTLAWTVGITDFVLKFICIILKSLVAMWPRSYVPYRQRGKYFMLIEKVIYFYGCLTPIAPWVYFLLDDSFGGQWFSTFLLLIYTIFKLNLVYIKSSDLWKTYQKFNSDMNLGTKPTSEEVHIAGESCPICHDDFANPVKLSCKHIFCEDCVSLWFDREQTCPMCRTRITDHTPCGEASTSYFIQWY